MPDGSCSSFHMTTQSIRPWISSRQEEWWKKAAGVPASEAGSDLYTNYTRSTLGLFWGKPWDDCSDTEREAYGHNDSCDAILIGIHENRKSRNGLSQWTSNGERICNANRFGCLPRLWSPAYRKIDSKYLCPRRKRKTYKYTMSTLTTWQSIHLQTDLLPSRALSSVLCWTCSRPCRRVVVGGVVAVAVGCHSNHFQDLRSQHFRIPRSVPADLMAWSKGKYIRSVNFVLSEYSYVDRFQVCRMAWVRERACWGGCKLDWRVWM